MDFEKVIKEHIERYPMMTPQDYCKLCYQNEFGPRHMLDNFEIAMDYIDREWYSLTGNEPIRSPEYIGNGLCRFYMNKNEYSKKASQLLGELFYLTAKDHVGSENGIKDKLDIIKKLPVSGISDYIAEYKDKGCPTVHHSEIYNELYKPHYRLLKWVYACYFKTLLEIKKLDKPAVIAIDGRCGSGKTGFASIIKTVFDCNVFHIDDYYLPLQKRADNWEQMPAGNIGLNRFNGEVLIPSKAGEMVNYHPYNCGTGKYKEAVLFKPKTLTIIEGSYSHHPLLNKSYDLKIFLSCDNEVQKQRLFDREGDYYSVFQKRWIPMEELYLSTFQIEKNSDIVVNTSLIF